MDVVFDIFMRVFGDRIGGDGKKNLFLQCVSASNRCHITSNYLIPCN